VTDMPLAPLLMLWCFLLPEPATGQRGMC